MKNLQFIRFCFVGIACISFLSINDSIGPVEHWKVFLDDSLIVEGELVSIDPKAILDLESFLAADTIYFDYYDASGFRLASGFSFELVISDYQSNHKLEFTGNTEHKCTFALPIILVRQFFSGMTLSKMKLTFAFWIKERKPIDKPITIAILELRS